MNRSLLELLVCPLCLGPLSANDFAGSNATRIETGVLVCDSCSTAYPVIKGIPRLLLHALQGMLWETHPDYFRENAARLPPQLRCPAKRGAEDKWDGALAAQQATARSFGYEWQAFPEMLPDYEANFRWYFERFEPSAFEGKRVLDAGCGTGRHTFHMSRTGAREVVAIDLSQAIEVASRNNKENPKTHFIQADIYHPPFRAATFDFIYSLGVLHHLPDPQSGFRALLPLLRPDGFINIYLYWDLEGEPGWRRGALEAVTAARRITTRIPHDLLKKLSWLIALGFEVGLVLPARLLDSFHATRPAADWIPLGHYRKYSFRVLYTDQFDRFSAPIENRYSRAEVAEWFAQSGIEDVVILRGAGWRASGRLARPVGPHLPQ